MNRVWRESSAKGSQLLLLLAVADFADDEGVAWPGIDALARKTRLSRRQTQYNIQALIRAGELELTNHGGAGAKDTNRYLVTPDKGAKIAPCKVSRVQSATNKGATGGKKRVQPIAPEPSGNHQEPSGGKKAPRRKNETPFPEEFILDGPCMDYAIGRGMDAERAEYQFERLRNWALANDVRKRDWMATWRNWVLKEIRDNGKGAGNYPSLTRINGGRGGERQIERPDLMGQDRLEWERKRYEQRQRQEQEAQRASS